MPHHESGPPRVWTVAEAKARLSEVLRLAEEEGPQRIGKRRPCVVVPEADWHGRSSQRKPLGRWLVKNVPRGVALPMPDSRASARATPFADEHEE